MVHLTMYGENRNCEGRCEVESLLGLILIVLTKHRNTLQFCAVCNAFCLCLPRRTIILGFRSGFSFDFSRVGFGFWFWFWVLGFGFGSGLGLGFGFGSGLGFGFWASSLDWDFCSASQ